MTDFCPQFMGGPKDGADVPTALWVLDSIEMVQHLGNGVKMLYLYELDEDTKNYMYKGQYDIGGEHE